MRSVRNRLFSGASGRHIPELDANREKVIELSPYGCLVRRYSPCTVSRKVRRKARFRVRSQA